MMAWAEDEMVRMGIMESEPVYDELNTGLKFSDIHKAVIGCYNGTVPSYVVENLLIKEQETQPGDRFAYNTLFVKPIIAEKLVGKEPSWFNPFKVMPDLESQVIRLVIGKKGYGLKQFTQKQGATFIWYDRDMMAFKIWGKCPSMKDNGMTIDDIAFNLTQMIEKQTIRQYDVALGKLYRSTERKRSAARMAPIYYCD